MSRNQYSITVSMIFVAHVIQHTLSSFDMSMNLTDIHIRITTHWTSNIDALIVLSIVFGEIVLRR